MRRSFKCVGVVTAVLAMVLTGGIAWGDVVVILPFESGDPVPSISGWSSASINTSESAGAGSSASLEVTSDSASGYWSATGGEFSTFDADALQYINFYVNVENASAIGDGGMYPFGGGGHMFADVPYPAPGTAGWTYISLNRALMSDSGMDWTSFSGLEVGDDAGSGGLVGSILYDHVTVSTTSAEGMLGAGGGGGGPLPCDLVLCDFEDGDNCTWYGGTEVSMTYDASSSFSFERTGGGAYGLNLPDDVGGAYTSLTIWVYYTGDTGPFWGHLNNESVADNGGNQTIDAGPPDTWNQIVLSLDPEDWDLAYFGPEDPGSRVMDWTGSVAFALYGAGSGATITYDDVCLSFSAAAAPVCEVVVCDFEDETDCAGNWYGGSIVSDTYDASSSFAWETTEAWATSMPAETALWSEATFWVKYTGEASNPGLNIWGGIGEGGFIAALDGWPTAPDTWSQVTVPTDPFLWDEFWDYGDADVVDWSGGDVDFYTEDNGFIVSGTVVVDDFCLGGNPVVPFVPLPGDADGDGITDDIEAALGTDPNDADDPGGEVPVAGLLGLGLLSLGVLAGGAALVRRKK